jgi:precorrin-2 dehydrogenase/sirohydrochlorin ferrochelatase
MLPLVLNVEGRLCLVVGGGTVGRRKAAAVLRAGGRVRLVCPGPPVRLAGTSQPEWIQECYQARHLDGVSLVFAAATGPVNAQALADARTRGLWVNVADDPAASDFHLAATVRRGGFLVAVSTGGAAPCLARAVRERLEGQFDDAYAEWVNLLGQLRPALRRVPAHRRKAVWDTLTEWRWLDRLRTAGPDQVRREME